MVLPLLALLACVPRAPDEAFLDGLDVVTVVAEPPQSYPLEPVAVTAWVADPWERGADVLVWPCTPVQIGERLRCGEGLDIEGRGMPLRLWVRRAQVVDHRADVLFNTPFLPYLAFEEVAAPAELRAGLPMPVVVLACDPGVCPLFDQVAADPEPGTEAYAVAARTLADLDRLAQQADRSRMALAVKEVRVKEPGAPRRSNPQLDVVSRRGLPDAAAFEWTLDATRARNTGLPFEDEDEGRGALSLRIGYTAGRLLDSSFQGDTLTVFWHGESRRGGVMVIGLSDGEGGTAGAAIELPEAP